VLVFEGTTLGSWEVLLEVTAISYSTWKYWRETAWEVSPEVRCIWSLRGHCSSLAVYCHSYKTYNQFLRKNKYRSPSCFICFLSPLLALYWYEQNIFAAFFECPSFYLYVATVFMYTSSGAHCALPSKSGWCLEGLCSTHLTYAYSDYNNSPKKLQLKIV
jgi:hypothetical protein